MIEFSNKSVQYSISNTGQNYKLIGSIRVDAEDNITDFNGTFYDLEDNYLGNFNYRENTEGNCDKYLNNVQKATFSTIDAFLDQTIEELKAGMPE